MKLTVVGPDKIYPNKEKIKKGDKLIIRKDTTSEYPYTIRVYDLAENPIGNIANSEHTAKEGTKLSSDIYDDMENELECTVEEITNVVFKNGTNSIGIIIELIEEEIEKNKGGINNMENKGVGIKKDGLFIVGGSKSDGHPNRYEPAKILKENPDKSIPVTLEFLDEKVIILYEGVSCGEVVKVVPDGYDDDAELISMAEKFGTEDIEAKIEGLMDAVKYSLKVSFKGETALEKVMNNLKKEKVLSNEEIGKRMKWLDKLNLNEKNITYIFENIGKDTTNDRIPKGDFIFINSDDVVEVVIASYNAALNILLEGPKASGKNTLIEDIGRLYNVPVYEMQINAQTDNETILGSKTLKAKSEETNKEVNTCLQGLMAIMSGNDEMLSTCAKNLMTTLTEGSDDEKAKKLSSAELLFNMDFTPLINAIKGGETEVHFEPSVLVKAMEQGGIIVFDEINTGHPSVMALLNSVLDNRRRIQVPGYGLVKAHPNFRAFATMNKDYQGTFEMNEATASRFVPVVFTEPASIKEIIKKNVPNVEKATLDIIDKIYKDIRKQTRSSMMQSQSINIRAFIYTCIQVEWGIPLKTALINNVANSCPDLDDRESIKKLVDLVVA